MTRLFLIAILFLSSSPVYAEWVLIGTGDDGRTVYADPDTIRRKGDLVKMWVLVDFKTIQTVVDDSYLSLKIQKEIDCPEERIRFLARQAFSGNMGSDKAVYSNSDETKWEPIAPDSTNHVLWIVACSKK